MKIAAAVVLFIVLIYIGARIVSFFGQEHQLNAQLAEVQTELTKAQYNEESLQEEMAYLANPINLEKELRARFNYKKPGETMIIIVPAQSSTPQTD